MKIWVDADACPEVIREVLFKAAERTGIQLKLVALLKSLSPIKNLPAGSIKALTSYICQKWKTTRTVPLS